MKALIAGCILLLLSGPLTAQQGVPNPAPPHPELRPVLDDFGGMPGLTALMDSFMEIMLEDPRLRPFFEHTENDRIKRQLAEQFCVILGGDCVYTGRDMVESHNGSIIDRADFNALVEDLQRWLRSERALLSKHAKVAKAIDYLLSPDHWPGFTRFLEDGRVCLTNNAAERALRGVALGRKSWLFAGSERGGHRAAFMYSLIGSAKMNGIDPQAWLADAIAKISDMPVSRLPELLPWVWSQPAHVLTEVA